MTAMTFAAAVADRIEDQRRDRGGALLPAEIVELDEAAVAVARQALGDPQPEGLAELCRWAGFAVETEPGSVYSATCKACGFTTGRTQSFGSICEAVDAHVGPVG